MSDIKILLVDDHAVVRMGFKMLIEAEPDMTVIEEAESGDCLLYTSPSPRDGLLSRMPSSA